MKKNKFLLYFLIFFAFILILNVISANSAVPVSSCGNIMQNTTLINDVSSSGTCFTIGTNNIVLDCQGYEIRHSSLEDGFGIKNSDGYDNIIIRNCKIRKSNSPTLSDYNSQEDIAGFGVYLDKGADNNIIEYNNFSKGKAGILVINSTNTIIQHNYGEYFEYGLGTEFAPCQPFIITNPYKYYESGIWFVDSNNATVYNNTIQGNETETGVYNHLGTETGITLCRSNYINISNNTIKAVDTFGIHLKNSTYNDIFYNFVNGSNGSGINNINDGIIIYLSSFNNVSYNEFYKCSEWGIFVLSLSNYNYVFNNTLDNNDNVGIRIKNSNNNIIKSNTVDSKVEVNSRGIEIYASNNSIISNNNVMTNGTFGHGIWILSSSKNNTLTNNTIKTSGSDAYTLYFSDNSDNNNVYDTITNATGAYDVNVWNSGTNNLTNCTFNKNSTSIDNGIIYVKWYLDVYVNYSNGSAVNMASVVVTGINGNSETAITNESGFIETAVISEYFQDSTGKYFFSPYTIIASKNGYRPAYRQTNLEYNEFIYLTLSDWNNNNIIDKKIDKKDNDNINKKENKIISKIIKEIKNFTTNFTNFAIDSSNEDKENQLSISK